jgi:hypothetical protein
MKALKEKFLNSSRLKNFVTFSSGGLLYFFVAPLQADPHHDGVILAPAVAYSEDLPLHAGAFSQYGPLSPLVSGLWLRVSDANLISLRYFAAFQAIILFIGLFLVLKKIVSENRARALVALWIFASGIWSTRFPGALMAWPSLLSSCILIFALLLSLDAIKEKSRFAEVQLALAGFLIAISGFARAQSWIIAGSVGLVLALMGRSMIKKIFTLCLGYILGFVVILGLVYSDGAVNDWWLQSIYWPTQIYPALGEGNNYNRFQMVLYIVESILLVSIVFITSWISIKFSKVASVIFLVVAVIMSLALGFWIPTLDSVPIRFRVLFGEPFERILVSPFYLATVVAVALLIWELRKKKINRDNQALLITSFGALSIIQLYPQSDVMHLWWIAPLIIPSLALWLILIEKSKPSWEKAFYRTITVFSICGSILGLSFINSDWKEYENLAFAGTYAGTEKVNSLKIYNKISEYTVEKKSSFDCPDGVYSVINRGYNAVDQWYVNWGFTAEVKPNPGEVRFICGKDRFYAESEAKRLGWKLIKFTSSSLNPEVTLAVLKPLSGKEELAK